jgi:2'-5' RNA ligase
MNTRRLHNILAEDKLENMERLIERILREDRKSVSRDCIMAMIDHPNWSHILDTVKDDDLYIARDDHYGKTTDPHVTLFYGLDAGTLENVDYYDAIFAYLQQLPLLLIRTTGISTFESAQYDVLKFDIELTEQLEKAHNFLKQFPYENAYKNYHPHCTIAYVKKGLGKYYADKLRHSFSVFCDQIIYSESDGTRHLIELNQI